MNLWVFDGRLTADTELKQTQSGTSVVHFTVACDDGYGEKKQTDFIDCTAFNKTAEFVAGHFGRGDGIKVFGKFHNNTYVTNGGQKRTHAECIVSGVEFPAGGKRKDEVQKPLYTESNAPKFEEITDDEGLPF